MIGDFPISPIMLRAKIANSVNSELPQSKCERVNERERVQNGHSNRDNDACNVIMNMTIMIWRLMAVENIHRSPQPIYRNTLLSMISTKKTTSLAT